MATTVHIPKSLLAFVDRGARRERISRNRFIVRALERAVREERNWSPDFLAQLTPLDVRGSRAVDNMIETIRVSRTTKGPPKL